MTTTKNNIPAGYKDSAAGIIPQEWEVKYLGDLLARLANGLTYDVSVSSGYPISRIETISSGEINYYKVGYIDSVAGCELYKMQNGDILYSHINSLAHVGKVAYYDGKQDLYHGMNLLLLRANNKVDSKYLYAYLLTPQAKHIAQVIAKPAVNQASISINDIRKIKLPVPPMWEQRWIAEILGVWDEAIEKQSRLVEKLELRKRALMQRLLTGRTRLPGFTTPWQKVKLGEIFDERNETKCENLPLLSITADKGVIPQSESDKKDISNEDKSKYKRICLNDIGYNTMRMWQGRSALSKIEGIVSPAYTIVTPKAEVDSLFISELIKQPRVVYDFWTHSQGLVGDTLNCKFYDFSQVKVAIPSLPEQKTIAEVLTTADNEIATHRKKLDALRLQKRGLMQQLLTGKTRVKI